METEVKRILVVDDQPEIRELVSATVSLIAVEEEYETLHAANGREAIEIARRTMPDLILMDVMMPEMNGLEATRVLKADPETRRCTILLLTAMGQKADHQNGLEFGADGYVVKPFSPTELMATIKRFTEGTRPVPAGPSAGER